MLLLSISCAPLLNRQVRDWIAPVNRRWPLRDLLGALEELYPRARPGGPRPHRGKRRHVLFEYVMLRDVNDSIDMAHKVCVTSGGTVTMWFVHPQILKHTCHPVA